MAILLAHRALCQEIVPKVQPDELSDSRNRELLRFLQDPSIPELEPMQLVAGLDDTLADHAERLLTTLEGKPEQLPGRIQHDALQTLENLGRERLAFLMRQLQGEIQAAEKSGDVAEVRALQGRIAALYVRHREFYPPPSPYFRDTRNAHPAP